MSYTSLLKVILVFIIPFFVINAGAQNPQGFDAMLKDLYIGSVPLISADSVAAVIAADDWLAIDAREMEEYEVSHLRNALFVGYENFSTEKLGEWPKASNIVVYCSVGYRSERIAEQLIDSGYVNVYNLRGGIFEWINTGFPVVDKAGNRVKLVHPYNENWGKWVIDYKKVYE